MYAYNVFTDSSDYELDEDYELVTSISNSSSLGAETCIQLSLVDDDIIENLSETFFVVVRSENAQVADDETEIMIENIDCKLLLTSVCIIVSPNWELYIHIENYPLNSYSRD